MSSKMSPMPLWFSYKRVVVVVMMVVLGGVRWLSFIQVHAASAESGVGSSLSHPHSSTLLLLFSPVQLSFLTAQEFKGGFELPRSALSNSTPTPPPKGVFVQRLVDEVQSVFWAKHAHPLTPGQTPTPTGLQTKITPSRLPGFLLNPLQHMTCVTATDLHRKIRPVEGQGKSPKQETGRGGWGGVGEQQTDVPLTPVFTDGLFKKFIFLKYLAYFMVL